MSNAALNVIARKALPTLTRRVGRQKLVLKKNSPHIFFALGIAGSVTSTVMACKATLKLPQTIEIIEMDLEQLRQVRSDHKKLSPARKIHYTDQDLKRDTAIAYGKAAGSLARLYGPAVTVGILSIASLTGSHVTMTRRNAQLMAAYAAVAKAYDDYRARVVEQLGEDKERELYHAKVAEHTTPDGEVVDVVDPNKWSPYAKVFDEGNANWQRNAEYNRLFVQCQQNYANERLRARGHLFLNEVYESLGLDHTQAGAVVGWVIGDKGDNFVDFGMYDAVNARFINGWERSIILDFNVDGVIFDKI